MAQLSGRQCFLICDLPRRSQSPHREVCPRWASGLWLRGRLAFRAFFGKRPEMHACNLSAGWGVPGSGPVEPPTGRPAGLLLALLSPQSPGPLYVRIKAAARLLRETELARSDQHAAGDPTTAVPQRGRGDHGLSYVMRCMMTIAHGVLWESQGKSRNEPVDITTVERLVDSTIQRVTGSGEGLLTMVREGTCAPVVHTWARFSGHSDCCDGAEWYTISCLRPCRGNSKPRRCVIFLDGILLITGCDRC